MLTYLIQFDPDDAETNIEDYCNGSDSEHQEARWRGTFVFEKTADVTIYMGPNKGVTAN